MQGEEQSHQPGLTPAERELEDALRGLRPAPSQIPRDRLLFDAGAAAKSRPTFSRALGLVAAGVAIGVGLSFLWPADPRVVAPVAYREPSSQPTAVAHAPVDKGVEGDSTAGAVSVHPNASQVAQATADGSQRLKVLIPVPTSPFVSVPPRFVNMSRVQFASDMRSSAYFTAIQNVLERGLEAIPSTRTFPADGPPADGSAPSPDASSAPATGGLEPS